MAQLNNTTGPVYDAQGNLVSAGAFVLNTSSALTPPVFVDTTLAEGSLANQTGAVDIAAIAAMSNTPANIALLNSALANSSDVALLASAQAQLAVWGVATAPD